MKNTEIAYIQHRVRAIRRELREYLRTLRAIRRAAGKKAVQK